MMGGNSETLISSFPPLTYPISISVPTHALSHMLPPHPLIALLGWGALAPQRRERYVCSGNITPLRFVFTMWIPHGSSDRKRRKRKMDITPYRFALHMFLRRRGASLSLLSPPPPFFRGRTVISSKKKRNVCHLHADNPIRAGYPNATPRSYAKLSLPTPPSRHKHAVFFSGIVLRTVFSPCRPCEPVSHRTCDVLLTHSRSQVHFLSPSTLSFVLRTKFSRLLSDLRLNQSWRPNGSGSVENCLFGSTFCLRCT